MATDALLAEHVNRVAQKVASKGIKLGTPLSEGQLHHFEQRHGISLPDGFRLFLLQIGNGGPGPAHYGLVPPGCPTNDMRGKEERYWRELPNIREPFPFSKTWVWEDGESSNEGGRDQIYHGCLCLGTDGCGAYWCVIVTGSERGNIWMMCGEGITPTAPKRDFLKWYEDWLDGVRNWWT